MASPARRRAQQTQQCLDLYFGSHIKRKFDDGADGTTEGGHGDNPRDHDGNSGSEPKKRRRMSPDGDGTTPSGPEVGPPPLCPGHQLAARLLNVKKNGPNFGTHLKPITMHAVCMSILCNPMITLATNQVDCFGRAPSHERNNARRHPTIMMHKYPCFACFSKQ